ncbi:MAG: GDP-mannose 4,6-dehydratase, partial [Chthoniobacterales bacterium]
MSKRSILVTGGAGFIGSKAADLFLREGWHVGILDDFNDFYDPAIKRANIAALPAKPEIFEGDIVDPVAVQRAFSPGWDVVLHLAARAGVRPSIAEPELYVRTNLLGTTHLLDAAVQGKVGKFIFASSSSVYGSTEDVPFRESAALRRTYSPYAATK